MNRGFPAHRRVAAFARRRRRENPLDPAARPGPPYAMASSFFIDVLLAVCAILGAIGFFRANAAHAELRALRRLMEERENPAAGGLNILRFHRRFARGASSAAFPLPRRCPN